MDWVKLYHLGDLALTIPAACALTAWLLAARAWRAAGGWLLAFGLALALVAATKIAFMGWATGLPALHFKALSGHATGFTAAVPTLCWLLAAPLGRRARGACALAALGMGVAVAVALVRAGEHTPAEALAGWLIGAATCAWAVRLVAAAPAPDPWRGGGAALLAAGIAAWAVAAAPLSHWMVRVALALSGNAAPHPWDHCG
ncbi:phosphatase PAP2 family protein [uncultured Massilia sp.]|uniref:phosphatase PAP2 family protein n=1 Tax=uncultured Massilia sp. TaxID=169973 RepID=UPI0025EF86FE|nr:phosphatase PAP2 family protein [uncultured Massilia sp.]